VRPTISGDRRPNLTLAVLFLGTFTLGSAELLVVGVLKPIADDFDVSIGATGSLVTAYALGLAVGGPALMALTVRMHRRRLLCAALAAYVAATVLAAAAPNLAVLLVARALTGTLQGAFVGVAFTIATAVVPPDRIGRAISAVLGGFAVSTAIGVPLGTLLGERIGWRGSFVADAVLGAVALVATALVVPPVAGASSAGTASQLRHAFAPRVLAILALAAVFFAGQYAALTYITPFLHDRTGISGALVSAFLLAYGGATALGALGGGRFADRDAARTVLVCAVALVAAFALLWTVGSVPILVAAVLVLWGLAGFGAVPSLQYRTIALAGPGAGIAASLPASAINAGIAIGSVLGGWAIGSYDARGPVVVALIVSVLAVPLAAATSRLRPPAVVPAAPPVAGPIPGRSSVVS